MSATVSRETTAVIGIRRLKEAMAPLPETRIITVANQKGGVGKTTTAVNIGAALAMGGLKVLLIDLDPQGNASTAFNVEHDEGVRGTYELLVEGASIASLRQRAEGYPKLDVVPAGVDLAGAEIDLVDLERREFKLRDAIDELQKNHSPESPERYDYIIIDCPPSLGLLTLNALIAADELLIPIQCEYYALEGLTQLIKIISLVTENTNPRLHIGAIMLTMFDGRTRLAHDVAANVRSFFPQHVLTTVIPRAVRVSEAPSHGQSVMTYDMSSPGALAYLAAARELHERGRK
jgi:chromosome partitioning protein